MTQEQEKMRELLVLRLNHAPFESFVIHFIDGAKFEIVRPFQAGIGLSKVLQTSLPEVRLGKPRQVFQPNQVRKFPSRMAHPFFQPRLPLIGIYTSGEAKV